MKPGKLWVDGWLSQLILIFMACVAMWFGLGQQAATCVVGSVIIGVIRQIERTRRG